jgi:hypothetical protein
MAITSAWEMANSPDPKALDFMINHVFLPPQLPQEDDSGAGYLNTTIRVFRDSVAQSLVLLPLSGMRLTCSTGS